MSPDLIFYMNLKWNARIELSLAILRLARASKPEYLKNQNYQAQHHIFQDVVLKEHYP